MAIARFEKIIVLTGAGLSAESGVPTFRDPDGIWSKYDWRDVATPDGFQRDPALVLDFYNSRRATEIVPAFVDRILASR